MIRVCLVRWIAISGRLGRIDLATELVWLFLSKSCFVSTRCTGWAVETLLRKEYLYLPAPLAVRLEK